jgi:putative radical SAM enzyme (TIGR03279 family)
MSEVSIRPALITAVLPDSIAAEIGFEIGDRLVSINGQRPRDLIDYQFLCADEVLALEVLDTAGKPHQVEIEKDYDDDLGLEFESALFDGLMQCNNRCPFCFIDQQPPGMRQTLYLKDDDYRLSFLYGSYLTLTNVSQREWDRIEQMRLSPLFVSVHATEPDIRSQLLKNPRAGQLLEQLRWFQERRLQIHAQVVLCPGINDRDHLTRTLLDLFEFHQDDVPAVASVAVVPVGLTRFRPSEDELIPVSREKAQEVIAQVQDLQAKFRQQVGSTFAWLADEWFLLAHQELPPESHYEDYPQIGNGVGSIRQFLKQFKALLEGCPNSWLIRVALHGSSAMQLNRPFSPSSIASIRYKG